MARRSVLLILCLICGLCSDCIPSVSTANTNLWLDCPCIQATEVNEDNRGVFLVNSSNPRLIRSDCVLIFVMGTASNIVQLELKDIQLQPKCHETDSKQCFGPMDSILLKHFMQLSISE